MEYTNKESFLTKIWNKIKNSAIGSIFNSEIDVPSDNELYKEITSEEGLSIEDARKIEQEFNNANKSALSNYTPPVQESKFKVKGINPNVIVEELPNIPRAKGGHERGEREL